LCAFNGTEKEVVESEEAEAGATEDVGVLRVRRLRRVLLRTLKMQERDALMAHDVDVQLIGQNNPFIYVTLKYYLSTHTHMLNSRLKSCHHIR
jgi:hypothetical protein